MYKQKYNFFTLLSSWFKKDTPVFVTRVSFIASLFFAIFGILLGIMEGSLAVQINGLIAGVDVLNSLLLITAVKHSIKSPDYVYNYGYGKYESLSTLASSGLFFIVSAYTLYEAISSFGQGETVSGNYYILISYSVISFFIMNFLHRYEKKASIKYNIPMLEYDSNIWKMDSYIELGIICNLILGVVLSYFDYNNLARIVDSITAVVLMGYALKTPLQGSKNALNQLLDRTLPDKLGFEIMSIVVEHLDKMCEYKSIHTRQSGKDIFIEIDVVLPFDSTMEEKNSLEFELQEAIIKKFPTAISRLYAKACGGDCMVNGIRKCPVTAIINR